MHPKFVKRLHETFMDKVRTEGKIVAKRWLSDTLTSYQDFLEVRTYTYRVLGLDTLQVTTTTTNT